MSRLPAFHSVHRLLRLHRLWIQQILPGLRILDSSVAGFWVWEEQPAASSFRSLIVRYTAKKKLSYLIDQINSITLTRSHF